MTVDEKLEIINRWCYHYEMGTHPKFDMQYGKVTFRENSLYSRHTEMRHGVDAVVEEAYWMVFNHVFAELDYISEVLT